MKSAGSKFTEKNTWLALSGVIGIIMAVPALYIAVAAFGHESGNWAHIRQFLLTEYVFNTMVLFVATGIVSSLLGVSLAYLVTVFDFPLRRFFRWALVLPLAIPTYIAAYTYSGMVGYTGAVTAVLKWTTGQLVLIDIMSIPGAIFIFSFFLFPYVYLISRGFLANYTASLIESARLLGRSDWQIFWDVILPVSRSVIASGCALVLMEVANDYGVVSYFSINTFSVAVFKVWFGMNDIFSAVWLCIYLMFFIIIVIFIEKALRRQRRYCLTCAKVQALTPRRLSGGKAAVAFLYCATVWCLGFLIPLLQLLAWTRLTYTEVLSAGFIEAVFNTVTAALVCSALILVLALIVTNSARVHRGMFAQIAGKMASVGYSMPGAVVAIGVLIFFVGLDKLFQNIVDYSFTTSLAMLYFAYLVRFLTIGCNAVENGFAKVGMSFFEASRTLGLGITRTFLKVDLPMIRTSLLGGFLLVFVDMVKELPLTLILRPFNFNTLASKVYEYAHDERVQYSAPTALIIILICALTSYLLTRIEQEVT